MAMRYLGEQIDIHGGGGDLIYPHHESEIAQSEGYTHKEPFSRFWVHIAMVRYEGEKMSKSLGNLVLARTVLRYHSPDALRLYLHSHHYRDSFEYEDSGPAEFEPMVDLLRSAMLIRGSNETPALDLEPMKEQFMAAIADDLDTPKAIGILNEMAKKLVAAAEAGHQIEDARTSLRTASSILGLRVTR